MIEEEDGWTVDVPWIGQYILDENGDAVPATGLRSWGRWLQDHVKERHLAQDQVGDSRVSTIFLGLDYGPRYIPRELEAISQERFSTHFVQRPELWETMVFGGPCDREMARYTSKEDALEGHRQIVERLRVENEKELTA